MTTELNVKLYTTDELVGCLRKSKTTIYRMVKDRKIGYHRIGSHIRFTEDDILDFLKNNSIKPAKKIWLYEK